MNCEPNQFEWDNGRVAQTNAGKSAPHFPSVPAGAEVARCETYPEAKKAVDSLLDGGVPPRSVSIVGEGLRSVERVTARYGYGRAALSSALTGSWIGLFVGLIIVTLGLDMSVAPLLAGIVIGAGLGMIIGMGLYTAQRGQRPTYRSVQQLIAEHYRVIVDSEHEGKAKRVLGGGSEA